MLGLNRDQHLSQLLRCSIAWLLVEANRDAVGHEGFVIVSLVVGLRGGTSISNDFESGLLCELLI